MGVENARAIWVNIAASDPSPCGRETRDQRWIEPSGRQALVTRLLNDRDPRKRLGTASAMASFGC